jgi:release factor glutamine methyltransferase
METETIPQAPKILGTAKVLGSVLITKYDRRESDQLVKILVEFVTKKPYKWLLMYPETTFTQEEFFIWESSAKRLLDGEPIQYITGEAWFAGLQLTVSPSVLIPRPETEELVEWVIETFDPQSSIQIVDIGSGSGCIALALAKKFTQAQVQGIDVSDAALEIARLNAEKLDIACRFLKMDVLAATSADFTDLDVVVSNPPYIPQKEYLQLAPHVRLHEPALALEVPDTDPLHYYIKVCELGRHWLKRGGWLFFEIHEDFGPQMVALLHSHGYQNVELRKDMSGRDRMVAGKNPD